MCSLDVAFTSATVRNRPREVAMAVPMAASLATVVTFGGFRRRVASFRVAGVALCDIPTCFITCQKSFCVAGAIYSHRFELQFSWQARHFGNLHRHFAWQAQHFRRVASRIFTNRIVRAASSGDTVQIAWQAWQFVRCAEN